jgi:hypothetical protein
MPLNITRTALAAALAGAIGIAAYVRIESLWSSNRTKRYVQSWRDFMAELREQRTCYVYEALGQPENKTIRLMELLPGIEYENVADYVNDPIRVNFRTVSLLDSQREPYEAITAGVIQLIPCLSRAMTAPISG